MDASNDAHEPLLYNSDVEVANHLRAAYAAVDRRSCAPNLHSSDSICPCASPILRDSFTLRELFTVTLNVEFLLARGERLAPVVLRQRHLEWYRAVQTALASLPCHLYDMLGLLCYWAKGLIAYELRAMGDAMGDGDISSSVALALSHAADLCTALRCRLPRLCVFLFPSVCKANEPSGAHCIFPLPAVVREAIAEALHEPQAAALLQSIFSTAMHQQREAFHRSGSAGAIQTPMHVFDLIRASAGSDTCVQETESPIYFFLRCVVDSCRRIFPREELRALLDPSRPNTARVEFLSYEWPSYCRAEMNAPPPQQQQQCVRPEWVAALLATTALLWDPGEPTAPKEDKTKEWETKEYETKEYEATEDNPVSPCVDLSRCFLSRLLRVALRAPFAALFDVSAAGDVLEQRGAVETISALAHGMASVHIPPCAALRRWESIGAGPPLPAKTPKAFGYAAMGSVCCDLLHEHLRRALTHILSEEENSWKTSETAPWSRLMRYLLRAECAFTEAFVDAPLRTHLIDHTRGVPYFYSAVAASFSNQPVAVAVDALSGALVEAVHMYVLRPAVSANPPNGILRNETDVHAALRLARCVASTNTFAKLYKDLLAHRLLLLSARGEEQPMQLQVERGLCAYVQNTFPCEGEEMRQMLNMCDDIAASIILQKDFQKQQQQQQQQHSDENVSNGVRLTVQVLSQLAWPPFSLLRIVPLPLRHAMEQFSTFYEQRHRNRRVVWLRTSREAVTFHVAFPRGAKTITGSLDLCAVFIALGNAGSIGLTWKELAQHTVVRDEPLALEREMRRLVTDKFFVSVDNARVRLNADFASRQAQYRFLQQSHTRSSGKTSEESQQSRLASTQAAIMKQMKAKHQCRYDVLFDLTQRSIGHFHLQAVVFKEALERLIEKEYIERDSTDKQWFIYKA